MTTSGQEQGKPSAGNRRILVVDDNDSIHEDFLRLLGSSVPASDVRELDELEELLFSTPTPPVRREKSGFDVDCASQGQEALEMVRSAVAKGAPYALAFVDMIMPPGWDGVTTIKKLWEVESQLEVVVCSAYSDYDWSQVIEELGENDQLIFLKKPFDSREVVQLANALTRKWALRRDAERTMNELENLVEKRTFELRRANQELTATIVERRRLARKIQQTISPPPELRTVTGFELYGRCQTCEECGGDWWTYRQLRGGRMLITLGDVTGHGIPSAMLASAARGAVDAYVAHGDPDSPEEILTTLDCVVREIGMEQFWMTCLVALLDPDSGRARIANAGHPQPFVLTSRGLKSLSAKGDPLGSPSAHFASSEVVLDLDDTLIFYSDGLTERENGKGQAFGFRRMNRLLSKSHAPVGEEQLRYIHNSLWHAAEEFGEGAPFSDDVTLVMCSYRGEL